MPQLPAPLWKWNNLFSKRCAWKDPSGMGEVRHTHVTTLRVRVRLWKNTSDATPLARFWSRLLFLLIFFNPCFFFLLFLKFLLLGHIMQHAGSWFPEQGSRPHPLHWNHGVLTTGLPGKVQVTPESPLCWLFPPPAHVK